MLTPRKIRAFTLLELLVVISIVAILIGISVPAMSLVRQRSLKVVCSSNLKQIGYAITMYVDQNTKVYPAARYMPEPFVSGDDDPPLTKVLDPYIANATGRSSEAYRCQADSQVFNLAGTSYMYQSELSGQRIEQFFPVAVMKIPLSQIVVARDFDGGVFDLTTGGSVAVPAFHDLRNLLFADGHAGNF